MFVTVELFEIELIICIKMDLALNNLQRLICHKTLPTNQVTRTFLSILGVLNNPVVWIVSTRPPTSKSSTPFKNPLVTVPKAPITIGMIVTFMFHSFFNSLARSRYLSFFSHSFNFIGIK